MPDRPSKLPYALGADLTEECVYALFQDGVDKIWGDLVEWDKDKGAQVQPGMRDLQAFLINDLLTVEEDIQVDQARPILESLHPPHFFFNPLQGPEERQGRQVGLHLNDLVEKLRLVRVAPGRCSKDGRFPTHRDVRRQGVFCRVQVGLTVAQIGAQGKGRCPRSFSCVFQNIQKVGEQSIGGGIRFRVSFKDAQPG